MKKSKLFVLLPMMALLLSGCQTEVVPSDAPSESTSEESSLGESPSEETSSGEYTPTVTYAVSITNSNEIASLTVGDSVVVAVSLITTTDGVDETVSGTASEVTLTCADPSIIGLEGLRITALNEGSTSIYATWTEHGVTSSSVTIEVGKEEVEPPVTHEYTYGVSITNGSELASLTVGDTKTVSVSLITYEDGVESTSVLATSNDVTLSSSATDVVSVSGLELTALSKGTSNISARWDEHNVSSNAVTVSVSEKEPEEEGEGGDTGSSEEPPAPTITYKLEITNAEDIREIQTGDSRLVEVTGYKYEDDIQTDSVSLDSSSVTLISSDPDYLSVEGLTITAEAAKEAIYLTARSEIYGTAVTPITVTANPDEEIVEDTYTYELTVNNQEELQTLAYGYGYEAPTSVTLDITLVTYINGEFAYSQKADTTMTDLEVISWNTSIVTTSGLTVTAVSEGSTAVEVKWLDHPLNGGGEGFSDLSYFVNVEVTEYFEPFTPISKIGFSQDSYTFVFNDDAEPVALEVNYEPNEATNPSYTVFSDDESIAKVEYCETTQNYILSPVSEGETDIHVVATDTENNPAAGTSHVVVEVARNPILSFGTSTMNIELEVGSSATIGYAPTGDDSEATGPDVEVYVNPDEPDNKAFTLSGEYDSEFLSISERDETSGLNTYTISALDGDDAGKESHTYSLDITADDEYSDASTRIYVTILTDDAKARPVEGISLSVPYVTIANNGSFTISNGDTSDVTVTVYGGESGVYEDGWNLIDYDSTLLDVDFDFATSVFTISAKEPDINQTVTTNLVFRTMGAPVKEARLAVYILRAEDYTADINVSTSSVSMLTDQTIVLGEDDNYTDFSVSIYNQYSEVLEGASWEASIDSTASGIGVLNSVSRVDGSADRLSITSGSKTGTGVIRISAEDDESIYTEISVSVSQQYYEVEQISCSLGTINLNYDLANDPKGASTYIQDSAISYYSSKGPVNPDYEGFILEYAGSYLSIGEDNRTITALLPTGDAGVNITVRSTTNTNATTTINVVVNDVTDYAVKTLTISPTSMDVSVSATQDNAPTDLAALGVTVTMSPEYATNTDYSVTSSDPSVVSVDGNNNITVKASKEDNSAELYIVASDNTYGASATLTLNVKTTYVKADSITVNYSNTALTTGETIDFDTNSYVVIGNTASGTVTDSSYTIESSNESVLSVNGHVVTAAGAGSATLTFTTVDGASVTTNTITVTDPRTEAKNVTVYFRLTDGSTTYSCPEYADIYCQGDFSTGNDTWDDAFALTAETYDSVTCYKATISTILLDTDISYRIIFTYSGDDLNWNHQSDTLTFRISDSDVADGGNLKIDATTGDPTTIIPAKDTSLGQFSVTIATKGTSSSSSVVNFSIVGDLNGWPTNGGDAMTKVSGNSSYDQYITYDWERDANFKIYFGGCSSDKTVWWDWNYCWTSNYSPKWDESTAYCWTSEPQFCFDLTGYSGKLDSYTNLTIVFTVNYSNCTSSVKSHSCITGITTILTA